MQPNKQDKIPSHPPNVSSSIMSPLVNREYSKQEKQTLRWCLANAIRDCKIDMHRATDNSRYYELCATLGELEALFEKLGGKIER